MMELTQQAFVSLAQSALNLPFLKSPLTRITYPAGQFRPRVVHLSLLLAKLCSSVTHHLLYTFLMWKLGLILCFNNKIIKSHSCIWGHYSVHENTLSKCLIYIPNSFEAAVFQVCMWRLMLMFITCGSAFRLTSYFCCIFTCYLFETGSAYAALAGLTFTIQPRKILYFFSFSCLHIPSAACATRRGLLPILQKTAARSLIWSLHSVPGKVLMADVCSVGKSWHLSYSSWV